MGKHKHKEEKDSCARKKYHKYKHYHRSDDKSCALNSEKKKSSLNPQPVFDEVKEPKYVEKNSSLTKRTAKLPVELTDPNFPWIVHRYTLNKIFFRDTDPIQRGTKIYDDFWIFLRKYQAVQVKAIQKMESLQNSKGSSEIFSIEPSVMKEMLIRGHIFEDDRKSKLTKERLTEFQYIINLYLDFLEKEKAAKLITLQKAQDNLPIRKYKEDILDAVKNNQIIVIAGDTGCGKSTQVPQYLLSAGYESIACTQPRRIACISLSKRVAYETQNEYGTQIGYQIRFEKSKTSNTKILFLTEGLLLRQVSSDPMLSNYSVVILDEVHERHLPCDFLLGVMKCLSIQRPDIKIILMSATINIELFSDYFNDCPVIQVPGRLYPIQVNYCPITTEELKTLGGCLNPSPYIRIMNMIDNKYPENERGDLLIFLSGMTEISTIAEAAKSYAEQTKKWIILPLHSTLSLEEQDKVFDIAPEGVRKCIISTNIAETSVTIDGIRFVVDSGKVKEMSYDPNCHMQRLQEFWISRASAEQRKGRAGRTGPGVCYRMYCEKEYNSMLAYSKPEIQRVSLDSILLQLISIGLPDARKFPFLEPPSVDCIEESIQSLKDQSALTDDEALTPMGKMLARLPVEVTIGKMLIHGCIFSLMEPVLSLAAALSVQSPYTSRTNRDPDIIAARQQLDSDHGDPFTLLNAYHKWLQEKAEQRGSSRTWCRRRGLEEQRFYEMSKLRKQFKELLKDAGLFPEEDNYTSSYERSHRYGELKQLKNMKRQYHHSPHTRKILKLDTGFEGFSEDVEEDKYRIDIKDIEFRLSHDKKQVYALSNSSQVTSYHEVICLKAIVCSGLYPRWAVPDMYNSIKSDSDQHFHTKAKPFVVMHPNGVFALQPDLIQLRDSDIEDVKKFRSQTAISTRHQLVAYMTLLETTKPFLVNCLRVQAAHVLLLLSHSIDTNQDFTRIICDSWLELRFSDESCIQDLISKSWKIRDTWEMLLKKTFEEITTDKEQKLHQIHKMGKELMGLIIDFFKIEIPYTVRRLLAADIKNLYIGSQQPSSSLFSNIVKDMEDCPINNVKGGSQIKDYLTYNCLSDSVDKHLQYLQKVWTCPFCNEEMIVTVLDQIRHKEKCQQLYSDEKDKPTTSENEGQNNPLKKEYSCSICDQKLHLTPTEILRHKRSHLDV